jgi:hypothetical protein
MIRPNRATIVFALTIAISLTGALLRSLQTGDDASFQPAYALYIAAPTGASCVLGKVRGAFDAAQRVGFSIPC